MGQSGKRGLFCNILLLKEKGLQHEYGKCVPPCRVEINFNTLFKKVGALYSKISFSLVKVSDSCSIRLPD